jgi:hypothetical protein
MMVMMKRIFKVSDLLSASSSRFDWDVKETSAKSLELVIAAASSCRAFCLPVSASFGGWKPPLPHSTQLAL